MPICIECRHPVETLWTEYSGAAGAKGHNIRLTVCRACGNFCDKYVEHDFVVMFIDLVLIKPQVSIYSSSPPHYLSHAVSLCVWRRESWSWLACEQRRGKMGLTG